MNKWIITEENIPKTQETIEHHETLFAQANGYLGLRGTFEEGLKRSPGAFVNAFYENHEIVYGEKAYGFPEESESLVKIPELRGLEIFIDGELLDLESGKVRNFLRTYDLKKGVVNKFYTYETSNNKKIEVSTQSLVSFIDKHLYTVRLNLKALNFDGQIDIVSTFEYSIENKVTLDDPRIGSQHGGKWLNSRDHGKVNGSKYILFETTNSNQQVLINCGLNYDKNQVINSEGFLSDLKMGEKVTFHLKENDSLQLEKYIGVFTKRDYELTIGQENFLEDSLNRFKDAMAVGFDYYLDHQQTYLNEFWETSQVEILGHDELSQGLNFNMYHLLQAAGKDGFTNVPAKGLTGEGYEGHYFWDTEIYVLPFFLYTNPEFARKLLKYRYSILDKAREKARTLNVQKGALYPWRTITGQESSAYFPAGTAQYHINADIAHAVNLYYEVTGDLAFMEKYGAEILFETARFWMEVGHFNERKDGQFTIEGVTGPDEYTAIVDNNYYTNKMAKENLFNAYKIHRILKYEESKDVLKHLKEKINLEDAEVDEWARASAKMYLGYDEALGIHPQDDTFLDKPKWDFEKTPQDKYPLLLNFHPLVIYRHQVLKQADVVLANLLVGEDVDQATKKRNFDYYIDLTTHDSSLSPCIYSIMAAEVGYIDQAYELYEDTVRMDLDNLHHNSMHGVHTASMGGSYLGIVCGFAGLRIKDDTIHFNPVIPKEIEGYRFNVQIRNSLLHVSVKADQTTYTLKKGNFIEFFHDEQLVSLEDVGDFINL